ncbi:MAG: diaminopimelate epimerase [Gaiellaceae bacterium]
MRFSKWQALGNAYLVVEDEALTAERARELCDPERGIGADGVLEIVAVDGARASVAVWNPDGSVAELSGNGARIAARWLAERSGADEVTLTFGKREVTGRMLAGDDVRLELGAVEVAETERLTVDGQLVEVTPVSVGNPHAVVRGEPDRDALLALGPALEHHERFPGRTNVQLVRVDGPGELTVLVWERGAGETAASGSSAVAAAAAAVANRWVESPVRVRMPGGELLVELDEENRATLTGPVTYVYSGEL